MATKDQGQESDENVSKDGSEPRTALVYQQVTLREMAAPADAAPESVLGDRIRYARSDLKLKVEALSRLTKEYDSQGNGISPTSISRYESGESLPGLREFRLLVEALDVPMTWLLYGTEEDHKSEISDVDRMMLHALQSFVMSRREDETLGGKAQLDWFRAEVRMNRLNKARKPTSDDIPD